MESSARGIAETQVNINVTGHDGRTALHAAANGHDDIAKYLLKNGAAVDGQ